MCAIRDYVFSTSLPAALKEELAGEYVMSQNAFYVELPGWLTPVFGGAVRAAQVEQLRFNSYFYFRFILAMDRVLDATPGTLDGGAVRATERMLTYCDLYERSVRGLTEMFPAADPFWSDLATCKKQYAASNVAEKRRNKERGTFTLEAFEALSADKSAVCNAVVYALARLGGTSEHVETLLACLGHIHVALQCMDDVEDFRDDWEQGQYTYAHAQVEAYLASQGLDASALTSQQVHPYLYVSGTADALYALGQEHLRQAIALTAPFHLDGLKEFMVHRIGRFGHYRENAAANLARARAKCESVSVAV